LLITTFKAKMYESIQRINEVYSSILLHMIFDK
jgi:hypothetical protein